MKKLIPLVLLLISCNRHRGALGEFCNEDMSCNYDRLECVQTLIIVSPPVGIPVYTCEPKRIK